MGGVPLPLTHPSISGQSPLYCRTCSTPLPSISLESLPTPISGQPLPYGFGFLSQQLYFSMKPLLTLLWSYTSQMRGPWVYAPCGTSRHLVLLPGDLSTPALGPVFLKVTPTFLMA